MTDTIPAPVPAATNHEPRALSVQHAAPDWASFGSIGEAMKFAEMIQNAEGAVPKHCLGKPGKILATVMAGHELGVGPMASLRAFHVVEGKPTADYSFWVARLKQAGYRIEWLERGQEKVRLRLTAPDGSTHDETWDKARAITAGLWNKSGPWKLYPQTMLSARCVTSAGRAFAAEIMFGCYETDEADEILRDAEARVTTTELPNGTAAERVGAAIGNTVDAENAAIETKARECADMLKALKLGRGDLFALLGELGIEHTDKTRLSELSREALDKLAERLDQEAATRGDGGPTNPPPGTEPKGGEARS